MSNINLNLYKIFCKVAQSKSYSEAAEKLDLSVANVSIKGCWKSDEEAV